MDLRIELFDRRRGTVREVPTCSDEDCDDAEPAWSPDGRLLAFTRDRSAVFETVIARANGTLQSSVTTGFGPVWSPDGRRFASAITRLPRPCCFFTKEEIAISNVDGSGGLHRITFRGGAEPDWSSRGVIVFRRNDRNGDSDLFTIRPDGTALRRLTYRGGDAPSWSPDAKRLVFVRRYKGSRGRYRDQLAIVGRNGGRPRRITSGGGTSPVWSPDGTKIAFVRGYKLMVLSVRKGARAHFTGIRGTISDLAWQPLPR